MPDIPQADNRKSGTFLSSASGWLGGYLCLLIGAKLLHLLFGHEYAGYAASVLVLLLPVIAMGRLRLREFYLLAICALLVLTAWLVGTDVAALVIRGLNQSAYLSSFILLMALLREGALTSNSIVEIGTYLTRQPPGRRFIAIFGGSHLLSVMINLGSLSLFAPIIQRGAQAAADGKGENGPQAKQYIRIQERRQLAASIRGFSWFLVWAPTAVTQAVMPTLMQNIDTLRLVYTGLLLATIMLVVSWLEDKIRWRVLEPQHPGGVHPQPSHPPPAPLLSFRNFALVCLALFGGAIGFTFATDVTIISGVMLVSPLVVSLWIFAQQRNGDYVLDAARTKIRLGEISLVSLPGYCREAVFIGCAGFIGTFAARLIPAEEMAQLIGLQEMPHWVVLTALSLSVWVFGQVGLSPITMAIFLASLVAEIPDFPGDMTHAALAIAAGTAICTTGAPFSSGAVMLARASGISAFTLTWRWNGTYVAICVVVLATFYALIGG